MNKFLFVLIVLLLAIAIVDQIAFISTSTYLVPAISMLGCAELLGIIMMLYNGTFRKSKFYRYALFAFGLVILSIVLKILHLIGADELLVISFPAIGICYVTYFFFKPEKKLLDYLKVLLVVLFLTGTDLAVLHLIDDPTSDSLRLAEQGLFWITFSLFIYQEGFRKRLLF